jgi:hypothetical protein
VAHFYRGNTIIDCGLLVHETLRSADDYRRFGVTRCLHCQGRNPEVRGSMVFGTDLPTSQIKGAFTHKTAIAVKTSNIITN